MAGRRWLGAVPRNAPTIAVGVLLAALPFALFAPHIGAGTHSFLTFFDAIEQTYPWYQKLARAVHAGHLPLWDPGTYSGHSFVGELQAGALYPLNVIWVALAGSAAGVPTLAIEILVLLHFSLAALGMWLLLRRWQLSPPGTIVGALLFAFSGAVAFRAAAQVGIFYGLCWLPWAMLFAARHFASRRMGDALAAGAVIGLQILAGHLQPALQTAVLVGSYGLAVDLASAAAATTRVRRLAWSALVIGGSAVAVALPQLLLSAQYLSDAYRWVGAPDPIGPGELVPWSVFGTQYILAPADLLSLLDPWTRSVSDANAPYVTMAGLGLVLVGMWVARTTAASAVDRARATWLWTILVVSLLIAAGNVTFLPIALRPLPLLGAIRELGRWVVLVHFAACVFAGIGTDSLWRAASIPSLPGAIRRGWLVAALVIGALVYASLPASGLLSAGARVQSALAAGLIGALLVLRRPAPRAAVLILTALAAATASWRLYLPERPPEMAVERRFARNAIVDFLEPYYGQYRVALADSERVPRNWGDVFRVQTKLGHGATMWRPYYDFMGYDWQLESRVNDLLNVRWVVSDKPLPLRLVVEDRASGLALYERATWLPRAFTRAELTRGPGGDVAHGRVELELYEDHLQRYRGHLERADEIIFAELDYPGWQAWVDGTRVAHHRAQIDDIPPLLRAVDVAAGEHVVEWRYCPFGFCLATGRG